MMFVAESHNTADPSAYLEAEAARVIELRKAGVIEKVLVKTDQSGAFIWLHGTDEAAARGSLESLPIAASGLTRFELTEVIDFDSIPGASS